ncbi:MAG: hypothetical protein GX862_01060 [Leucobacter sp.]|nr:hypothetical protein [Leucobacter sp.]
MSFLPWRNPTRQPVTTGWWGWFPNIPRRAFGRVIWVLIVGGVSLGFLVMAIVSITALFRASEAQQGGVWSWLLTALFGGVLMPAGCLVFAWHLLSGLALARKEDREAAAVALELQQSEAQVSEARARLTRAAGF